MQRSCLHRSVSMQLLCPKSFYYADASAAKIVTNVVVQIIILLYLIDNNEQTSWMILMGSGVGVVIEAWKVVLFPHRVRTMPNFDTRSQRRLTSALYPRARVRGSPTNWTLKVTLSLYVKCNVDTASQISMS